MDNVATQRTPTKEAPMDKAIETKGGRFYIAMGYNGFNLPANNGSGYATAARALAAAKRCGYRPGHADPIAEMVAAYRKEG
jgi:hypothetical protein